MKQTKHLLQVLLFQSYGFGVNEHIVTYQDQTNKIQNDKAEESFFCASLSKLPACNRTNPFNTESVIPRDFLLDDRALVYGSSKGIY